MATQMPGEGNGGVGGDPASGPDDTAAATGVESAESAGGGREDQTGRGQTAGGQTQTARVEEAQADNPSLEVDMDELLRNLEDPQTIALLDLINIC